MLMGWRPLDPQRVQIPLGVRVLPEPVVPVHLPEFTGSGRPRRYGVQSPMDEDAEFRILKPGGYLVRGKRKPVWLKSRLPGGLSIRSHQACRGHPQKSLMKCTSVHDITSIVKCIMWLKGVQLIFRSL